MTLQTIATPIANIPSPINWTTDNRYINPYAGEDSEILFLSKATDGKVTLNDIGDALEEYKRLYKAGIASNAEVLTLSRAYPDSKIYSKALSKMGIDADSEAMVIGGPASIELVDREGHLITTDALRTAFTKYMKNFRTRNAMVLHSDVQVGWALPAYISKGGQIFKSGVNDQSLFFITELRNDTKISQKVMEQITSGKLKSYSIAGSAIKTQNIQKGLQEVMQVDELELAEVTVCEKGVNQGASFDILKAENAATSSCVDGSCLINKEDTCDCGCKSEVELMYKSDGDIDFTKSFFKFVETNKVPLQKIVQEEGKMYGESFATLMNTQGRQDEHHRLLDAYGFPGELEPEYARYTPVIEEDPTPLAHKIPPWNVNEAGQNLGSRYYDEALTPPQLGRYTKRGVAEGSNSTETPIKQLNTTDSFSNVISSVANQKAKEAGHPWYSPEIEVKIAKAKLEGQDLTKFLGALLAPIAAVAGGLGAGVADAAGGVAEETAADTELSVKKSKDFFNWMHSNNHMYKEACPCEYCFQKTADYKGTVERPFLP